jgi:hypothetical protein
MTISSFTQLLNGASSGDLKIEGFFLFVEQVMSVILLLTVDNCILFLATVRFKSHTANAQLRTSSDSKLT